MPQVIDYVIPPENGRDFHNLVECLLDLVFHTTSLFIGLILFFRQEKPCPQELLGSQGLVPIVSSGPVKILRVDQVHQEELGKGVIGFLYDMVYICLGNQEPGIIPTKITGPVSLNGKKSYEVQFNKGTGDGVEVLTVETPPTG